MQKCIELRKMATKNFEPFFSKHANTEFFKYGLAGSTTYSGAKNKRHKILCKIGKSAVAL